MARQEDLADPMTPETSSRFFRSKEERDRRLVTKAHISLN